MTTWKVDYVLGGENICICDAIFGVWWLVVVVVGAYTIAIILRFNLAHWLYDFSYW